MRDKEELEKYGFDLEAQKLAKRYNRAGRRLDYINYAISIPIILLFTVYGSSHLAEWSRALTGNAWFKHLLYVAVFYAGFSLLDLPFDYRGYKIEKKFDLSNQNRISWLSDQAKGFLISLVLALVILPSIFLLISFSGLWWFYSWLVITALMIFMGFISPTLLMPLFYNFEPLEDRDLAERLNSLARKAGVDVVGTYRMDAGEKTEKAIGGLTGIGSTRRIILSDTLLDNFTKEEIETVIAHELGHHVNGDMGWGIFQSSMITLLGLYVANLFLKPFAALFGLSVGIEALPVLMILLGILFFLLSPVDNWISRIRERKADSFARDLTKAFSAQAQTFIKLCKRNLSDASPHPLVEYLFYDHPSALRRVRAAKKGSEGEG